MTCTWNGIERLAPSGAGDSKQKRTYKTVHRVLSDSISDGPRTAAACTGVPAFFERWFEDTGAFVVNKQAEMAEIVSVDGNPRYLWLVTVEYSSELQDYCPTESDNPLDRPPLIEWDDWIIQKRVEKAIARLDSNDQVLEEDVPVMTVVGEKFDPPLIDDIPMPMCRIQMNIASWDLITSMQYKNAVNEDEFELDGLTVQVGTACMKKFVAKPKYAGAEAGCQKYFELHCEIFFKETWIEDVLHQGWKHYEDDGAGEPVTVDGRKIELNASDDDSRSDKRPVLLRDNGTKLAQGESPTYRHYRIKRTQPFATLGLPTGA